ncbi:MAG: non-heme chloroperoxidase [Verrucomicrobiales bacterium]|jgi:non-heme chloroperoxidase
MVQKKLAIPALGAGALVLGVVAGRQLVSRWRQNPDPLHGTPVAFPVGEQRQVELPDGAVINTITVGTGPTVVCVHGLTASRHNWGPMAPLLVRAGYRLLAIDQRGHGDSTAGANRYGSTQLGHDLAFVLRALDVQALALMGHSMGGMAAMSYAVDHEEDFRRRIETLILVATAGSLKTARHSLGLRLGGIGIPGSLRPPKERLRVAVGLGAFGAHPSLHMIDEAIRSFENCSEDVRQAATSELRGHDVLDRLHSVVAPALVIGGTRDQLIRPFQVRQLAAALDRRELVMFDGAGHMLIWERHRDIVDRIVDFLARNSAGAVAGPGSHVEPT